RSHYSLLFTHHIQLPSISFFFKDTATTEIYTLSLHDALPIWSDVTANFYAGVAAQMIDIDRVAARSEIGNLDAEFSGLADVNHRSEEHTSELQSLAYLVCRLLLEKKNTSLTGCPSAAVFPSTS